MESKREVEKRIREYLLESLSNKYGVKFIFVKYGTSSHGVWVENDKGEKRPLFDSRDIYRTEAFLDTMLDYDHHFSRIEKAKQGK